MQNWPNQTTKLCQEAFPAKLERTAWKFKKSVNFSKSVTSDFTFGFVNLLVENLKLSEEILYLKR